MSSRLVWLARKLRRAAVSSRLNVVVDEELAFIGKKRWLRKLFRDGIGEFEVKIKLYRDGVVRGLPLILRGKALR